MAFLGCFENADFTQLGFIDNLQSKKEKKLTKTSWTHCWVAELRQLIGRLSSEFNMWVHVWRKQTLGKQDRGDRRYLVLCPANAIFKIWKRLLKRNNSCVVLLKLTGKWNIHIFVSLCLAVFLLCLFPFEVSNGRFLFCPWVFVCNLSQDNRRFMSKQININHFAVPNRVKEQYKLCPGEVTPYWRGLIDIWESLLHFHGLENWVNQIPVQFFLHNNPNLNLIHSLS